MFQGQVVYRFPHLFHRFRLKGHAINLGEPVVWGGRGGT